jgi:hypothetical protein
MKHIWYYVQWLFRDFDVWNCIILCSLILNCIGAVFVLNGNDRWYMWCSGAGWALLILFFGKLVYDIERNRYNRFKKEQAKMFNTLKD